MNKEDKEYNIDVVTAKGIFLQKKDCFDNGSNMVLEIVKKGQWKHGPNNDIIYTGWKAIIRKTDDLYQYSHRRVADVKIVAVDGNEDNMMMELKRVNGKTYASTNRCN
jgi:hypothetical protein